MKLEKLGLSIDFDYPKLNLYRLNSLSKVVQKYSRT